MPSTRAVLALIDTIYEAALDERRWPEALQGLVDFTGSQAATFWVLEGSERPRLPTFAYINFDPAFVGEYLERMAPLDPTVQYLVGHPDQPIVHDGLVIAEGDKDRHPYYDWHGRGSDTRFRLVAQARPATAVHAGVALHRTRGAGRYEPRDIEQFSVLYPHLERALRIGSRLGSLGAMQQCTTELLDRGPAAVVLLDEGKRVVYANRAATALCSSGDGIRMAAGGIALLHRQDNDRLQSAISRVLSGDGGCDGAGAGPIRAQRPSGKQPYAILVTPVSKRYPALSAFRPAVCLVVTDPDGREPLPGHRLQAAFGLTGAEARLAALLAAGDHLRSAAEKLNVTYGTARTRLAAILQKTGTHRQGELIKLLLTTLTPR